MTHTHFLRIVVNAIPTRITNYFKQYLKCKLPRVVVHSAAVHEREDVPDAGWVENLGAGDGADAAVGQGGTHHREDLGVNFERAELRHQSIEQSSKHRKMAASTVPTWK